MNIRLATRNDIGDIERIYSIARDVMRENGNRSQWINGYPQRSLIEEDIARKASYLIDEAGHIGAVFMFAVENDSTYDVIEDGAWLNDEPYGVIHRIGSDGVLHGTLAAATQFALQHCNNVRIDTHADNSIMQHALMKAGFVRCGIIYCHDGSPRIAFQKESSSAHDDVPERRERQSTHGIGDDA